MLLFGLLAIGLHIWFLIYVIQNIGLLWFLAVLLFPIVGLYLYYANWSDLKYIFLGQVACYLVFFSFA